MAILICHKQYVFRKMTEQRLIYIRAVYVSLRWAGYLNVVINKNYQSATS